MILQKHADKTLTPFDDKNPVTDGKQVASISRATAKIWADTNVDHLNAWGLYAPPTVDVKPVYDEATQRLEGPTIVYSETAITRTWVAVAKSKAEQISYIKNKAGADIIDIMPEYKQRNTIARGVEVLLKVVLEAHKPTAAEIAEITAGTDIWSQIKAIREKSDADESAIV